MTDKLYAFEWIGGGYNTVTAKNTKEAYAKAVEKGKPGGGMIVTLVPNRGSFTAKPEFIERLERKWAGCLD